MFEIEKKQLKKITHFEKTTYKREKSKNSLNEERKPKIISIATCLMRIKREEN